MFLIFFIVFYKVDSSPKYLLISDKNDAKSVSFIFIEI